MYREHPWTFLLFFFGLLIFACAILWAAVVPSPAAMSCRPYVRHCWCLQHGPKQGCQLWTCRNVCSK